MAISTLVILMAAAVEPPVVEARFIGNSAFELSDGTSTILVDFPYQSGAFEYMTFPAGELRPRPGSLCLFTHRHADHFSPDDVATIGCSVAGPAEVQAAVPRASREGDGPLWQFGGARIECLTTEHARVEHCSYLVSWHGVEIFFSGDIGDLGALARIDRPLDAVFVPAWTASTVDAIPSDRSHARFVVHHHRSNEEIAPCSRCVVPSQGSTLTLRAGHPGPREP